MILAGSFFSKTFLKKPPHLPRRITPIALISQVAALSGPPFPPSPSVSLSLCLSVSLSLSLSLSLSVSVSLCLSLSLSLSLSICLSLSVYRSLCLSLSLPVSLSLSVSFPVSLPVSLCLSVSFSGWCFTRAPHPGTSTQSESLAKTALNSGPQPLPHEQTLQMPNLFETCSARPAGPFHHWAASLAPSMCEAAVSGRLPPSQVGGSPR